MVPELEKPKVTEIQVRMDCNGCVQKIKKALHGINGIYDIYIDMPQQKLAIIGWADPEKIVKAIKKTRKSAIICSESEPPPPLSDGDHASPSGEQTPINEPQNQPPDAGETPQPTECQANEPPRSKVEEVHVVYRYPPDDRSHGGLRFSHKPPQPVHVNHSYNMYMPTPHVNEYEYIRPPQYVSYNRPEPPPRYTAYSWPEPPQHYRQYNFPQPPPPQRYSRPPPPQTYGRLDPPPQDYQRQEQTPQNYGQQEPPPQIYDCPEPPPQHHSQQEPQLKNYGRPEPPPQHYSQQESIAQTYSRSAPPPQHYSQPESPQQYIHHSRQEPPQPYSNYQHPPPHIRHSKPESPPVEAYYRRLEPPDYMNDDGEITSHYGEEDPINGCRIV